MDGRLAQSCGPREIHGVRLLIEQESLGWDSVTACNLGRG